MCTMCSKKMERIVRTLARLFWQLRCYLDSEVSFIKTNTLTEGAHTQAQSNDNALQLWPCLCTEHSLLLPAVTRCVCIIYSVPNPGPSQTNRGQQSGYVPLPLISVHPSSGGLGVHPPMYTLCASVSQNQAWHGLSNWIFSWWLRVRFWKTHLPSTTSTEDSPL